MHHLSNSKIPKYKKKTNTNFQRMLLILLLVEVFGKIRQDMLNHK